MVAKVLNVFLGKNKGGVGELPIRVSPAPPTTNPLTYFSLAVGFAFSAARLTGSGCLIWSTLALTRS